MTDEFRSSKNGLPPLPLALDELLRKEHALYIVKLVHSALMYLVFSMQQEEFDRKTNNNDFVPGIELPILR